MKTITDQEFGEITVRTRKNVSRISIKLAPKGNLEVVAPPRTPLIAIKTLLQTSRSEIRRIYQQHQQLRTYTTDQTIGKSHRLIIQSSVRDGVSLTGTKIVVNISPETDIHSQNTQSEIRQMIAKALRKEAKGYLPRRLSYLAKAHGFTFTKTRITHASSRWGSCSSTGTISLNIALMQLPFELIDYVLIHELCHTREMNHSSNFWDEVAKIDTSYKIHRQAIKNYSPHI